MISSDGFERRIREISKLKGDLTVDNVIDRLDENFRSTGTHEMLLRMIADQEMVSYLKESLLSESHTIDPKGLICPRYHNDLARIFLEPGSFKDNKSSSMKKLCDLMTLILPVTSSKDAHNTGYVNLQPYDVKSSRSSSLFVMPSTYLNVDQIGNKNNGYATSIVRDSRNTLFLQNIGAMCEASKGKVFATTLGVSSWIDEEDSGHAIGFSAEVDNDGKIRKIVWRNSNGHSHVSGFVEYLWPILSVLNSQGLLSDQMKSDFENFNSSVIGRSDPKSAILAWRDKHHDDSCVDREWLSLCGSICEFPGKYKTQKNDIQCLRHASLWATDIHEFGSRHGRLPNVYVRHDKRSSKFTISDQDILDIAKNDRKIYKINGKEVGLNDYKDIIQHCADVTCDWFQQVIDSAFGIFVGNESERDISDKLKSELSRAISDLSSATGDFSIVYECDKGNESEFVIKSKDPEIRKLSKALSIFADGFLGSSLEMDVNSEKKFNEEDVLRLKLSFTLRAIQFIKMAKKCPGYVDAYIEQHEKMRTQKDRVHRDVQKNQSRTDHQDAERSRRKMGYTQTHRPTSYSIY